MNRIVALQRQQILFVHFQLSSLLYCLFPDPSSPRLIELGIMASPEETDCNDFN